MIYIGRPKLNETEYVIKQIETYRELRWDLEVLEVKKAQLIRYRNNPEVKIIINLLNQKIAKRKKSIETILKIRKAVKINT